MYMGLYTFTYVCVDSSRTVLVEEYHAQTLSFISMLIAAELYTRAQYYFFLSIRICIDSSRTVHLSTTDILYPININISKPAVMIIILL